MRQVPYFLRDAWLTLRRPWIPTMVTVVVVFAGTLAIFATTGMAMSGQQRTLDRINSPEGRLITLTDSTGGAGLTGSSVATAASLSGVEWAVGVSPVVDVHNPLLHGGVAVPARHLVGDLPEALVAWTSREPDPGDAIASRSTWQRLGMSGPVGAIRGHGMEAVITGQFTAQAPLQGLENDVLVISEPQRNLRLLRVYVMVTDVSSLPGVTRALPLVVGADHPERLVLQTSPELASLSSDVSAELSRQARLTVGGLLSTLR